MTEISTAPREGQKTVEGDPARFREPTYYINFDEPAVRDFAADRVRGARTDVDKAIRLFYAVRDEIRYDPYSLRFGPEFFRASYTLDQKVGWCVPKGVLMAAASRSAGLSARVGYADVRNHLTTPRLMDLMGTDIFSYHGYVEIYLNDRWVKATPVFDKSLCERFKVVPQEFDGAKDSLFQQFDAVGRRHMEYVKDHGPYDDLPLEEIMDDFSSRYPKYVERQRRGQVAGDFAAEAKPV
ncbi:MAG: transglutaminase-like domain-containing protein [Alphaproteobacteria bacterium]